MKLPPPEAQDAEIISYVDALEDECMRDPNRRAWNRSKQRWLDLYTGNHWASAITGTTFDSGREPEEIAPPRSSASSIVRIVYNRVMNAVLAHLAGQISNPPKVVFNARESGDPPIYYLNGYVQNPIVQKLAMEMGAGHEATQQTAQIYGPEHEETAKTATQVGLSIPLQEPFITQIKMMIDQGKMATIQARMQGLPPPQNILPAEALVEITDQSTSQFTQTVFDALWEQCGGIEAVNENVLNKKILGWQATLFESDRTKIDVGDSPITLTNVEGAQVYLDPMTSSFRTGRYRIMREPVSVEEGIAKYPEAAKVIQSKAAQGTLSSRLVRNGFGDRIAHLDFGRDMAVVRTLWIKDWCYPMDPDEAVAKGKVQIGQVPDESEIPARPGLPIDVQQQSGLGNAVEGNQPASNASDADPGNAGGVQPDRATGRNLGGEPITSIGMVAAPQPPTRPAYLHSDTGEEVTPAHPNWPMIYAIREIRDIEGVRVFDRRCYLPIFPIEPNINIPVPFSPYGIGEPDRLDGLQMAINRILGDLLNFHRYNAYPPELIRQSILDALPAQFRKIRSQPNSLMGIPDNSADQVGGDLSKCTQFLELPQMSPDAWKLLEFLVDAIDKEANNTEPNQGIAPSGTSGAWVANLQAAASQVINVTSISTESWLKKLVRLFDHFITHDMTVEDIQKYTSKYPPAIIAAFHERKKAIYLDYGVEIDSGSAASKQQRVGQMMQARSMGIPVSAPEIMSGMNLDPDAQLKQQGDFNQKMIETGAMEAAPPAAPEQQQPQSSAA